MNQTQNLGLPVYGANDKPSWMDTNNGFEKLDNIVGGAANVHLDFANPLYTFDATHLEYTAVKDCYLYGTIIGQENAQFNIRINGTKVAGGFVSTNSSYPTISFSPLLLRVGDVVTVSALDPTYTYRDCLGVYEGEIVSDTFVWNEAIVELDYANPLYTFTAGGSYTCEKRCWMIGTCMNTAVSVNGKRIADGSSGYYSNIPLTPLSKGDVINVTTGGTGVNIQVLDGTIKGSAPGFAGSGDVLELLDIANAVVLTTTNYTTPKVGCIVGGIYKNAENLKIILDDDTTHPLTYADGSNRTCVFIPGIPKGSRLKLNTSNSSAVSFIPYKYESIAPEITVYNEAEVELDYANPLHTFTSGHYTYTVAGDDEWLCGNLNNGDSKVSINGTIIGVGLGDSGRCSYPYMAPLKVSRGDVIAVTSNFDYLHVFKGTISGSVGNLTGAWIPNYSDHIASLTYNGGTYTATQDCIVEFGMLAVNTGTTATIQVNGNKIGRACSYSNGIVPVDKQIKLKKGDIFTWSNADANSFLGEVYGLM